MTERNFKALFTWRSAICESELPPTSRHVALTLSLHMNERGGSCFPSQATLATETGLAVKTVSDHLKILNSSGWLAKKVIRRGEGRGTRVEYSATTPPLTTGGLTTGGLTTGGLTDDQPTFNGTTNPRQTGCVEDDSEGDRRATVSSSPSTPSLELVIAEHTEPDRFDDFWRSYGNLAGTGKKKAKECWNTAMKRGDDPNAIIAGLEAWVIYWRTPGASKAMYAQGFLNQQKWSTEPPPLHADKRTATQVGNDMANGIVKEETLQFIETLAAIGEAK
jgi:hypothetical protein